MNIKPSIFTIISAISCISFVGDAFADTCDAAGWYRWEKSSTATDWCMPCPEGCYCPNNAEKTKIITGGAQWQTCRSGLEQYGIIDCGDGWTSAKINTSCMLPGNGKQTYCQGAMTFGQCFFTSKEGTKVYGNARSIKCAPGTYTKTGYAKCQTCKTGYICPGKMAYNDQMKMNPVKPSSEWKSGWKYWEDKLLLSPRSDSGIYLCPSGSVANSKHTACEKGSTYCAAGKYLPANATSCKDCKDRYYCLGGSFKPASFDQGLKTCPSGQKPDSLKKSCIKDTSSSSSSSGKSVTCPAGQYLPANASSCKECKDRYYCLGGTFTTGSTDQGLKTCYLSQPNAYKTNCVVTCGSGYYLPARRNTCTSCKEGYSCPGGTFITGQNTTDQGLSDGANKAPTSVSCSAGFYLPAGTSKCQICKSGHYCKDGGTFNLASYDQGAIPCPENSAPNTSRTACEYGAIPCEPGTYLPAKGTKCVSCPTTKNYCPGGTFKQADYDQGLKICPNMTTANSKKSACTISLTKDQMKFGLSNSSSTETDEQCWTKNNMDDFMRCMFGGKMVISYTPGDIVKTDEKQ